MQIENARIKTALKAQYLNVEKIMKKWKIKKGGRSRGQKEVENP